MNTQRIVHGALVTIAAATVLGCTVAEVPTAPKSVPAQPSSALLGGLTSQLLDVVDGTLLQCDALPYASTTRVIGSSGGRIDVGPHSLTIPPGALEGPVAITATMPSDRTVSAQFAPEGLVFSKPATLTLSYAHCRNLLKLPVQVAYTTDDLRILELLQSADDRRRKQVRTDLDHFSRYAASWRTKTSDPDSGLSDSESTSSSSR